MNPIEAAIAAAVDPVLDELIRLEKTMANLPPAPAGTPGRDGAGLEAEAWRAGVYREGAVVCHFLGQYFRAVKDTAAEPGESDDWKRLGLIGLRWRGALEEGAAVAAGDLYTRDGSLFQVDHAGQAHLINYRGERGRRGEPGAPAKGAGLLEVEAGTDSLVFTLEKGEREVDLRPLVERIAEEIVLRHVRPVLEQIGVRLANLERGL